MAIMTKFIGVSLTFLLVASMASAVLIEQQEEYTVDQRVVDLTRELTKELTDKGFNSGAMLYHDDGLVLANTANFKALKYEIYTIIINIDDVEYFKANGVVLGGVRYKLVKTDEKRLVAEKGSDGIVIARYSSTSTWFIGVFDKRLPIANAENAIDDVYTGLGLY